MYVTAFKVGSTTLSPFVCWFNNSCLAHAILLIDFTCQQLNSPGPAIFDRLVVAFEPTSFPLFCLSFALFCLSFALFCVRLYTYFVVSGTTLAIVPESVLNAIVTILKPLILSAPSDFWTGTTCISMTMAAVTALPNITLRFGVFGLFSCITADSYLIILSNNCCLVCLQVIRLQLSLTLLCIRGNT